MQAMLLIPWFQAQPKTFDLPLLGEFTFQPFGVLVWVGLAVGTFVGLWFAKKHDRSPAMALDLALYLVAFSFPISYLLNGLFYQTDAFMQVMRNPSQFLNIPLGWSSFGGIVGAITGGLVWKWRRKASLLKVGDAAAFAGPFGWALARLGCFVTHDHPGRPTDFFLAVADFQTGSPPYVPRHDLGFYDLLLFIVIGALFLYLSRKDRPHGFYVALLPILYTPFRFAFDFLRAPPTEGGDIRYLGLTPGQYAAIALFITGIVILRGTGSPSKTPAIAGS